MGQNDILHRFILEQRGIRGEWVQLTESWQAIKKNQHGPDIAQHLLGQAMAAVVLLSATIKFKGSLILQAQGNGSIQTLVAQASHDRNIRGLVKSDAEVSGDSLEQQFGQGHLVLTIKQEQAAPYQGIIGLQGDTLAAALESYFNQSEQLKTRLWLFANDHHAVGLLLQELPGNNDTTDWEHIEILANTVTASELMTLSCQHMLHLLFNEENIRLFDAEPVNFYCSCSRAKIERTLKALGADELHDILQEQGKIEVRCEFCNKQYRFDSIDVTQLLASPDLTQISTTQH